MRRPRFSLLSLILFTLLCGSATTLFLHYPAWRTLFKSEPNLWRHEVAPKGDYLLTMTSNSVSTLRKISGESVWEMPDSQASFDEKLPLVWKHRQSADEIVDDRSIWDLERNVWVDLGKVRTAHLDNTSSSSKFGTAIYEDIHSVFDVRTGREVLHWPRTRGRYVYSNFSSDDRSVIRYTKTHVEHWDLETKAKTNEFPLPKSAEFQFSQDHSLLVYPDEEKETIFVCDGRSGLSAFCIDVPNSEPSHDDHELMIALSPDNSFLLFWDNVEPIQYAQFWNIRERKMAFDFMEFYGSDLEILYFTFHKQKLTTHFSNPHMNSQIDVWLPAFWTTLTFAILFFWNLFRRVK